MRFRGRERWDSVVAVLTLASDNERQSDGWRGEEEEGKGSEVKEDKARELGVGLQLLPLLHLLKVKSRGNTGRGRRERG